MKSYLILVNFYFRFEKHGKLTMNGLKASLWGLILTTVFASASNAYNYNPHNTVNGIIQNPVVSCQDVKKKILCLPLEYSKFDLPYRNDHNLIDIGKCKVHLIKIIRSPISK